MQQISAGNLCLHEAVPTPKKMCEPVCLGHSYLYVSQAVSLPMKFFFFATQT